MGVGSETVNVFAIFLGLPKPCNSVQIIPFISRREAVFNPHDFHCEPVFRQYPTLPETNIAPETLGLEDEFPFGFRLNIAGENC